MPSVQREVCVITEGGNGVPALAAHVDETRAFLHLVQVAVDRDFD
jgi:hypothetical protein